MSFDVCRICLAGNVKMLPIANSQLQDIYEKLSSNQWNRDSRPNAVCYVCHSQLRSSLRLRVMSKQSEEIFAQLFAGGLEFTEETIPILHKRKLRKLMAIPVVTFSIDPISNSWYDGKDISITQQEEVSIKIEEISTDTAQGMDKMDVVKDRVNTKDAIKYENMEVIANILSSQDEIAEKGIIIYSSNEDSLEDSPHNVISDKPSKVDKKVKSHEEVKKDAAKNRARKRAINSNKRYSKAKRIERNGTKEETVIVHNSTNDTFKLGVSKKDNVKHSPCKEDNKTEHKYKTSTPNKNRHSRKRIINKTTQITEPSITSTVDNKINKYAKKNTFKTKTELHNTQSSDTNRSVCFKLKFNISNPNGQSKTTQSRTRKKEYPFDLYDKSSNKELNEMRYVCMHCDKSFIFKHSLEKHMRTHEKKPYICNICDSAFSLESSFKLHQKTHIKPYVCEECPKKFYRSQHLNRHIHTHYSTNRYVCQVCEKSFLQQSNLQQHMRTHTGEKPYGCDKCDKRFKQKSHLLQHERVHTKEKPYSCDICHKTFGQLSNLQQHRRIHIGEKPYKCDVCHSAFHQKSNLLQHISRLHGEDEE